MTALDSLLQEFTAEAATTRRLLDRVPADQLGWRPHLRSMSLGQLALHIALVPGGIASITAANSFDVSTNSFAHPAPSGLAEIHAAFDASIDAVRKTLTTATDASAEATWHLLAGDQEIDRMPRASAWRSLMLNHWYHHRGQLAVYLRLLDIPVPSIYGPSADDNPFASAPAPAPAKLPPTPACLLNRQRARSQPPARRSRTALLTLTSLHPPAPLTRGRRFCVPA